MKGKIFQILIVLAVSFNVHANDLINEANMKITELDSLVSVAKEKDFGTKREELALWVAKNFLIYADWDQANVSKNEILFGRYKDYKADKTDLANELPDRERRDVVKLLDAAILELTEVIKGKVVRRDVPMIDWENIKRGEDQLTCNDNPVFLFDYFSKSQGTSTTNQAVYNDYLGNIDHPNCISCHYLNSDYSIQNGRLNSINKESVKFGYTMLWHKPLAAWQKSIPQVTSGKCLYVAYDIDNPSMDSIWVKILKNVARTIKGKKYIDMGYCLANEPHWYSEENFWTQKSGEMNSISSYTLSKFQKWLDLKYLHKISDLNNLWKTNFSSFSDVRWDVPISVSYHGKPQWYDWCRFNMCRVTSWFTMLHDAIKSSDPNAPTNIKIMSEMFSGNARHHGIDLEALTKLTDYIGDDAKTWGGSDNGNYAYHWNSLAMMYDFMESVSPSKIHVNMESHFLSTSQWREMNMQPNYVRNVYWLATLLGMDANLSWFWARNPDGSIEDRFFNGTYNTNCYTGSAAQQPLVVNAYAKIMMDMNAYSSEIMKLRRMNKNIRIFYSETAAINDDEYMTKDYNLYESLFFDGMPLGYVTENILNGQDNDLWKVVVVYKTACVTDDEFEALQKYLDNGGTVIIDGKNSLIRNEHGELRSDFLKPSNGCLYNLGSSSTLDEIDTKVCSVMSNAKALPCINLSESNSYSKDACMWRVFKDDDDSYLMTIVNLGLSSADISLSFRDNVKIKNVVNLFNSQEMGTSFSLESKGILLLKIKAEEGSADLVKKEIADSSPEIITNNKSLIVLNQQGKSVCVYNVSGNIVFSGKLISNRQNIYLIPGVYFVRVQGLDIKPFCCY